MNLIFDFVKTYWREIASCLCMVISVVFYIIKKRPVYNGVDEIKKDVLEILPLLINKVEVDGNGQRKKTAVLTLVGQYLKKKYHFDCSPDLNEWLGEMIESILTTPQKKG